MQNLNLAITSVAISVAFAFAAESMAAPWIDTTDPYLKSSIAALSNAGVLRAPVNTYPLMWKSISADIDNAQMATMPEYLRFALSHAKHALHENRKKTTVGIKLKAASKTNDFQSLGEQHYAKREVNLYSEAIGEHWAGKADVHISHLPNNDKHLGFQGSYLAGMFGNWVVGVDQVSQWWGPGNDSVLALSNNAIAFPALRITRHSAEPLDWPLIRYLGPIGMTTYFGQQEHSNKIDNIRLWGMRINFKPIPALEIGLTRTTQWGGAGRPTSFSTFKNLLIGRDNAGAGGNVSNQNEPGNQLAGFDFRFSYDLFNHPFALYGERIGEDEAGKLPARNMSQYGVETFFGDTNGMYHLFAEYTDTFVNCNVGAGLGNCAYEHHIYTEGYRRYGRSMGSTYDSDAEVITIGLNHSQTGGHSWYGKLKFMTLNKDNANSVYAINPVSAFEQDRVQIEGGYSFPLRGGLLNVEAAVFRSKNQQTGESDNDQILQASWEYRF